MAIVSDGQSGHLAKGGGKAPPSNAGASSSTLADSPPSGKTTPAQEVLLNTAFLQEIKDSNPHLWHQTHELRSLCQLDSAHLESPQQSIKSFVSGLDELRDLLSLQFTLEESYGFIAVGTSDSLSELPVSPIRSSLRNQIQSAMEQHRRLYLQLVDLVEQAEELQYRGCESTCLALFSQSADEFLQDLSMHERFEAELIRSHESNVE